MDSSDSASLATHGQLRQCIFSHTWEAQTMHLQPHMDSADNAPSATQGQLRQCTYSHTWTAQTMHFQPHMDSSDNASLATHGQLRQCTFSHTWTVQTMHLQPHMDSADNASLTTDDSNSCSCVVIQTITGFLFRQLTHQVSVLKCQVTMPGLPTSPAVVVAPAQDQGLAGAPGSGHACYGA